MLASGTFDVSLAPQSDADQPSGFGRMTMSKQFHGDLVGTSTGQMLTSSGAESESGGYVAIEQFSGTLHGRRGTFVLQHSATMTRGTPWLHIIVVPDSGTDDLTGLTGTLRIEIMPDGEHRYALEYTLV